MKKVLFAAILVSQFGAAVFAQEFKVIKSLPIKGETRWDYIAVHPANGNIYVSHGTSVEVISPDGTQVASFAHTDGVHGICFAEDLNKGFISNGKLNTVTVFNMTTNEVIAQIETGKNPDFIMYDPHTKTVIAGCGRSEELTVIDAATNQKMQNIPVGGKPEAIVSDEAGKLFVNIEDKNEIVVVNMGGMKVTDRWHLKKGEEPAGLGYNKTTKRLFAGCGNKILEVMDATNGKSITTLPIGDGCDAVGYDSEWGNIYASCGDGTLAVISEKPKDKYKVVQNVVTKKSARTCAVNLKTHHIYLPAADLAPVAPGAEPAKGHHPALAPNTFQILEVGK